MNPRILNIGCGPFQYPEYLNSDIEMDISKSWPYQDNEIDAVVSQHVFQELHWKELIYAFQEAYRVLKKGGYIRFGVPTVKKNMSLQRMMSWGNKNLLTKEILEMVLETIGFKNFTQVEYTKTNSGLRLTLIDNRPGETTFFEAQK
jgi:hypothetical protein